MTLETAIATARELYAVHGRRRSGGRLLRVRPVPTTPGLAADCAAWGVQIYATEGLGTFADTRLGAIFAALDLLRLRDFYLR